MRAVTSAVLYGRVKQFVPASAGSMIRREIRFVKLFVKPV